MTQIYCSALRPLRLCGEFWTRICRISRMSADRSLKIA
jgi:hypothetical protein